MSDPLLELRGQLDRWTTAGIIDAGQAVMIESAERARAGEETSRSRRAFPLVAEVLGYLGAAVALSAAYIAIEQLWPRVPTAVELSFSGIAAVCLIVTGGMLATRGEPAYARLRSVLWMVATAAGAGFAAILASDVLALGDRGTLLTSAATWAGLAIVLWWRNKSALLHVVMFGGLLALLSAGIYQVDPNLRVAGYGTAFWVLSAIWGLAAYRGYVGPSAAGLAAASSGVLAGATITMGSPGGQALAVATVAGLLAIGAAMNRVMFTGFGAAGTLWVVPVVASRYLPGSVAAPVAVSAVGLVLLAIALWLARTRRKTG